MSPRQPAPGCDVAAVSSWYRTYVSVMCVSSGCVCRMLCWAVVDERKEALCGFLKACCTLPAVSTHPSFAAFLDPKPMPGEKVALASRTTRVR